MLTSVIKTNSKIKKRSHGQQGFSLLEVLMAIFLIIVVVTLIPLGIGGDDHAKLEDSLKKIERALRFATDESVLRNKIVRIKFILDELPISYTIEYGQSANLVLPQEKDLENLSLRDRELELEKRKELNSQFASVPEFENDAEPFDEMIDFVGLGNTSSENLLKQGSAYIYLYPTGEKDAAIIFLATPEEMGYITVSPFEQRTETSFYTFTEAEMDDYDSTVERKSKEIFEQWQKE